MPGDTKNCEDCGGSHNQNPLDSCGREQLGCNNPCGHGPGNTPKCESLPSQIQNFTDQFFGTVVKTLVNGQVVWSLPCQLDVGLPGNPRGVDEGLACYFLRLFRDGLGGLKGDKGDSGAAGANGTNAFTVVTRGFTQPTSSSPLVQFLVLANPAILPGMNVFIAGSGYYLVTDVQAGGIVFATFQVAAPNPVGYVAAGALVIPTGANAVGVPGATGQKGDQGAQGIQGVEGPSGPVVTKHNGYAYATESNPAYSLTDTFAAASFGGLLIQFTAPEAGIYLVNVTASVLTTTQTATAPNSPELVKSRLKLVNTTTATDIGGTEVFSGFVFTNTASLQATNQAITATVYLGLGDTVTLEARADAPQAGVTVGQAWAQVKTAALTWVQIA